MKIPKHYQRCPLDFGLFLDVVYQYDLINGEIKILSTSIQGKEVEIPDPESLIDDEILTYNEMTIDE